jgi:hypothetical protein
VKELRDFQQESVDNLLEGLNIIDTKKTNNAGTILRYNGGIN